MSNQHAALTDDDLRHAVALVEQHGGVSQAARATGMPRSTLHDRLSMAQQGGLGGGAQTLRVRDNPRYQTWTRQLFADIDDGYVIVGSDAHIWPGRPTVSMEALLLVTTALGSQVRMLVANGDFVDGARTNRHDPDGWNSRPSVKDEIDGVQEALLAWRLAAKRAKPRTIYTIGNHEKNFERKLVAQVKEFEGMPGFRLQDHFPDWEMCLSLGVNWASERRVMIKHRHAGGVHAGYNNTMKAGCSTVTGHTHGLEAKPWGDYGGRRWGVQTGTLADPDGPQFEYAENAPSPACSGFAVLRFREGRMLPPELCEVIDGRAYWRGEAIVEDRAAA